MIAPVASPSPFIAPRFSRTAAASLPQSAQAAPTPTPAAGTRETIDGMLDGALRSYQALPSFLYPAVTGTAAEKAFIFRALDQLPMKDVGSIPAIRVVPSLDFLHKGPGTILGVTVGTGDMAISRGGITRVNGGVFSDDLLRYTLVHETGHARDLHGGLLKTFLFRDSNRGPWGQEPFVTRYAESARVEDYAEGHTFYHLKPEELNRAGMSGRTDDLKSFNPQKWQAMHADEQPNFMERIVEQKPFRETGRMFGEMLSSHVGGAVHTALGAISLASMVSLVTTGASETVQAALHPNGVGLAKGLLTLGAGASLAFGFAHPVLAPASLALLGARRGVDVAEDKAALNSKAPVARAMAAAAAGGAVGGIVGGVVGPLGGTLLGYQLAGPVGGVVGLVTGSLVGFRGGSTLGAKAGLAIEERVAA